MSYFAILMWDRNILYKKSGRSRTKYLNRMYILLFYSPLICFLCHCCSYKLKFRFKMYMNRCFQSCILKTWTSTWTKREKWKHLHFVSKPTNSRRDYYLAIVDNDVCYGYIMACPINYVLFLLNQALRADPSHSVFFLFYCFCATDVHLYIYTHAQWFLYVGFVIRFDMLLSNIIV